jgi:hypothetical protein
MQSLSWYVNRLGRMSAAELAYRLGQAARSTQDRIVKTHEAPVPSPSRSHVHPPFVHVPEDVDSKPYLQSANRILAGHYSMFHLDDVVLGHPVTWNRDPLTGIEAPLAPAGSIDYRDERLVGNIKYLWEPNRHLHIATLAQAYVLSGERVYADAVRAHIESWIEQCPPGRGANWCSSLELGIRLINWSIAWQLLGGYEAPVFADASGRAFRERWIESVYRHARAIVRKLSRYSSANNHLIGETAGVYIASVTWNFWPQMRSWGIECKEILGQEAIVQNAEDGGNKEQAFSYQQFVLDFLVLAGLAARAANEDFEPDYWQRIERMLEFLAAMMDVAGHVPMIGDADDGYVVRLSPHDGLVPGDSASDNYRSLLATGALLFNRSDFARKARQVDDKTRWLLPSDRVRAFDRLAASSTPVSARRAFPQSGYYVLGSDFDTPEEVRMIVDAGPLGYLSIAAHGHADALSVVLNVGGEEVLVDPGTYAYHTEPEWRRYFRSTRAHNTVAVDDCDQSTQSGNFMWSRHAIARCLHFGEQGGVQRFLGEHDGYCALSDPIEHQREILYDSGLRMFTIKDILEGAGSHEVCLNWHFSERIGPVAREDEIAASTARHRVRIVPKSMPAHVAVYRAGTPDEGGWISRRFGHKEPTTTVAWRYAARGRTELVTYIYVEPRD